MGVSHNDCKMLWSCPAGGIVTIQGRKAERELARLCIDITLQQRNNGRLKFDLEDLKVLANSLLYLCLLEECMCAFCRRFLALLNSMVK